MNGRPRITVDWGALRMFHENGEVEVPDITDDKPAGGVTQLMDALVDGGTITVPEPYRLSLINDDEADITGLIVTVEREGEGWPLVSDGWSDINNYLPLMEADDRQSYEVLEQLVSAVIGRADRCIAFLHHVNELRELAGDVALGNSEYDDLSAIAARITYP